MMKKHALAVLGYLVATFGAQATSHFLLFSDHYAEVSHLRKEPLFALGLLSMLLQGSLLTLIFTKTRFYSRSLFDAVKLSWAFGLFLVSYIGLAEVAKYQVPNVAAWIGIEFLVGFIQFTGAGMLLGLSHRPRIS